MSPEEIDGKIAEMKKVDYERIGERMFVEFLFCSYVGNGVDKYVELVKKAVAADRAIILECWDVEACQGRFGSLQGHQDPWTARPWRTGRL